MLKVFGGSEGLVSHLKIVSE